MVYTTTALVEAELRASASFDATTSPTLTQVTTWIAEESAQIDSDAGQSFAQTTYTDVIDYDGYDRVQLKHSPVITVNAVTYTTADLGSSGYALTNTAIENTHYAVYTDRAEIEILPNWSGLREGSKTMSVNYDAGYATTPAVVQKLATKMVAKRVIDSYAANITNTGGTGKSVSVGSISIVKSADFGVSQYNQLKDDIRDLQDKLTTNFGVHRYTNY